jgi:hypothetical protein
VNEKPFDLKRAIGMAKAARLLRSRGGKAPNIETLRRWANPKKGCRPTGADGPKLFLRTVRIGNELLTMPEWVEHFEAERIRQGERQPLPPRPPSNRRRAAESREADRIFAAAGMRPGQPPGPPFTRNGRTYRRGLTSSPAASIVGDHKSDSADV